MVHSKGRRLSNAFLAFLTFATFPVFFYKKVISFVRNVKIVKNQLFGITLLMASSDNVLIGLRKIKGGALF